MLTRMIPALYRRLGIQRLLIHPIGEKLFLAAYFLYKRFAEDPFAALTRKHPELFRGGDIIDVGANAGYTALVFAGVASPTGRVWAFEPEPLNFARLQRVIARSGLQSVIQPIQAAIGEHAGEAALRINEGHPGDHWIGEDIDPLTDALMVPMTTLDRFVTEYGIGDVAFVKVDVQGYELFVSRGMARLLETPISVAFEISSDSRTRFDYEAGELLGFYASRGFNLHLIARNGTLAPATVERVERRLQHRGYADILATRRF
jgi:FkbM family methyltransferase